MPEWRFSLHERGPDTEATIKMVAGGVFQLTYWINNSRGPGVLTARDMQGRRTYEEAEELFKQQAVECGVPGERIVFRRQVD